MMNGSSGSVALCCGVSFVAGVTAGLVWMNSRRKNKAPSILTRKCNYDTQVADTSTREGLLQVFDSLCGELVQDLSVYDLSHVSSAALRRMIKYNLPGGKLNRGLTVVSTAKKIRATQRFKCGAESEFLYKAAVLGWCIEWLQASFLVSDDLMDSSVTRRGQPCWYKNPDIGLIAVNDGLVLLTQVDLLLHKYFGDDVDLFMQLHQIMTETTYQTEMGQFLDLTTQPPQGPIDLSLYTEERYNLIVKYKTAFYSFYAPIALGMICAGVKDRKSLAVAKEICVEMGTYFQIQDDYLDCYGAPEVIGKIGTDIQDSKCSWLFVNALKLASHSQKQVLYDNYGKDDPKCIERVKEVFNQVGLPALYEEYEEKVYKDICSRIEREVKTVPKDIYYYLLNKIYKRSK